jgi:polysaccharide deacetylase family protein (PEP-CTERM system associated)
VDVGVNFLLEILAERQIRATFFILGWIATYHPRLVRRIADAGHEIGCHSNLHRLVYRLSPDEFRRDTLAAVKAIEDAAGVTPRMYRAPSYSVTRKSLWALEVLAACGFTHDSSIYPIAHDRYGIPQFPRHASYVETPAGGILEVPVATVRLGRHVVPVGGGAYMRLFPYRYTAAGLRRINQQEKHPACLYLHPWELDADQPRLAKNMISRLRTYSGLRGMCAKMERLINEFRFSTLTEVFPFPDLLPAAGTDAADIGQTGALYPQRGQIALEPVAYYRADLSGACD